MVPPAVGRYRESREGCGSGCRQCRHHRGRQERPSLAVLSSLRV